MVCIDVKGKVVKPKSQNWSLKKSAIFGPPQIAILSRYLRLWGTKNGTSGPRNLSGIVLRCFSDLSAMSPSPINHVVVIWRTSVALWRGDE